MSIGSEMPPSRKAESTESPRSWAWARAGFDSVASSSSDRDTEKEARVRRAIQEVLGKRGLSLTADSADSPDSPDSPDLLISFDGFRDVEVEFKPVKDPRWLEHGSPIRSGWTPWTLELRIESPERYPRWRGWAQAEKRVETNEEDDWLKEAVARIWDQFEETTL